MLYGFCCICPKFRGISLSPFQCRCSSPSKLSPLSVSLDLVFLCTVRCAVLRGQPGAHCVLHDNPICLAQGCLQTDFGSRPPHIHPLLPLHRAFSTALQPGIQWCPALEGPKVGGRACASPGIQIPTPRAGPMCGPAAILSYVGWGSAGRAE